MKKEEIVESLKNEDSKQEVLSKLTQTNDPEIIREMIALFDNDGMSDFLRGIEGVEVSFCVTELKSNLYKISFRSRKKYIINDIAGEFGGGGHMLAAGATVEADNIQELTNSIIHHLEKRINDGN